MMPRGCRSGNHRTRSAFALTVAPGGGALRVDLLGFLDETLDEAILRDLLDHLALHHEEALPLAGGDPEIGLARLAGSVHHASHDRHADRNLQPLSLDRVLDLLGQAEHVDLGAAAAWACDEVEAPLAKAERLQDLRPHLHLLDRVVGEAHADR